MTQPASADPGPPARTYAGIFLVSAAALLLQVVFMRIFSVAIWYHFAFLIVSIALFGFGASGVALSRIPAGPRDASRLPWAAGLFGASALGAYLGTNAIPFSPFRILQSPAQIFYFLAYDLLLLAPFFFAGLTIGLLLRSHPGRAGRLYAFDLAGAGVGALLPFVALPLVGAPASVLGVAVLAVLSAACFAPSRRACLALTAIALAMAPLLAHPQWIPEVRIDETKPLGQSLRRHSRPLFSGWNALSRIDVLRRPNGQLAILIDGAAATRTPRSGTERLDEDVNALPYEITPRASVVIIGSGGGRDVHNALARGAESIVAVEINPTIIDLVTGRFREEVSGVFADPRVTLVEDEGRSFIARSRDRADVIQITLIDTWAAGATGAYSLTENYLYTTEAFVAYLEHLTPRGLVSIMRWDFETPRLVKLGRAALERAGVQEAWRHIVVLAARDAAHCVFLMRREPFADADIRAVRSYAERVQASVLYDPLRPDEGGIYAELLRGSVPGPAELSSPSNLAPVGDDSPFFFQMARWRSLSLRGLREFRGVDFLEPVELPVGQIALLAALVLSLLLAGALIAVALAGRSPPVQERGRWVGYFLALGLAYIAVEIVLMQRFALFLGHPTYSVTTTLFALLLFSGLGSEWSQRRSGPIGRVLRPVVLLLPLAILLLNYAVPPIVRELIGLPHPLRLLLAVAFIAPVAFLMGVPFPVGIRALGATSPHALPLAWAANGCASVVGSVAAVLGAMAFSFSAVILAAGAIYVVALVGVSRGSARVP